MPNIFACVGVKCDNRIGEEIVTASRTSDLLIPRLGVADPKIDVVVFLIVRESMPDGAATPQLPPLSLPSLGVHRHGFAPKPFGRISGYGVEAPSFLAGINIVRCHISAHRLVIGTSKADPHLVTVTPWWSPVIAD